MVYFTCNSCGDSVQKPRVSKHISYECKKKFLGVSLCCVDCLKNFDAYTYVDHTKCVSELERYSGNNFVMKASSNKGEKKQGSWIDTVRSVLDQPALTRQQRQFLDAISQFENVPRKKPKFQNFVKSSIRSIRVFPDVVDSVFDLLEKEFKKSAAVTSAPESKASSEATKDSTIGENPKSDEKERDLKKEKSDDKSSVNGEQSSPEKKKKKRKIETQDENENFDDPENDSKVMKKKKKTEENDDVVLENGEHVANDDEEISRKKKKKKTKLSNGTSCDTVETDATGETGTEEAAMQNGEDITQKKKKKKRSSTIHDEDSGLGGDTMNNHTNIDNTRTEEKMVNGNKEIPQINGEKISKKKKKRRSKGLDESEAFCNDGVDDIPTDEKKIKLSNSDNQEECALHNGSNIEETVNSSEKKKKKKQKCNGVGVADENEESSNKKTSNKVTKKHRENHCDSTNKTDEEQSSLNLENHDSKSVLEIDHEKATGEPETCGKFDWTDVVTSILSKSSSGELSLKKMEKKVVKEYHNFYGDEMTFEKIVKRLTKKIPKMTTIEVHGGKIRLRGSEL